jgi:hypothetical protein
MDTRILAAILIAVVVLVVVAVLLTMRKRKSEQLRSHYGPEYERALQQHGDARRAEAALLQREKRVEKFSIRPLPAEERQRYMDDWAAVQRRFVDDPALAITEADQLVTFVMAARGYPMVDFEQRAADISVHYPGVVQNYRFARQIVLRNGEGQSTTEDLRQAMIYFRSLFEELLTSPTAQRTGATYERLAS